MNSEQDLLDEDINKLTRNSLHSLYSIVKQLIDDHLDTIEDNISDEENKFEYRNTQYENKWRRIFKVYYS